MAPPKPEPNPLADIDQLIANLPVTPMDGSYFGAGSSASSASSYVTPQKGVWEVYLGSREDIDPVPGREDGEGGHFARDLGRTTKTDEILGTDQAAGQIYAWDEKRLSKWADHLVSNGLLKPGEFNFSDLVQMWQGAVEEAGNLYTLGGKKVTPWKFIETYAGANGLSGGAGGSGSDGPSTTVQKNIVEYDDLDARAAAEDAYSALLGRKANGKEAAALKQAMNAYAQAHPSISTTVNDGEGNSTTTNRGGVDNIGQLVQEQVRAEPDYAEYQAATTMFNWLQQAMGSTADV